MLNMFSTAGCRRWLSLLLFLVLMPCSVCLLGAQNRRSDNADNYHFFYLSGGLGYSALDVQENDAVALGNMGGLAGAGYEFRRSKFWISLGAQMSWHTSTLQMNNFSYGPIAGEDIYGVPVQFKYAFRQCDEHHFSQLEVPLMMGYYYSGFYVGAGFKVGFRSVGATVRTTGEFDLTGDYSEVYQLGDVNYAELGYKTYSFAYDHSVNLALNGAVIGELGYDILSTVRTRSHACQILKVGFYFEYGLNSIIPDKQTAEHISFPFKDRQGKPDATHPQVMPYYYSAAGTAKRIAPYLLGVKLTYMIGGSRTGITGTWHRGCQCYE